jgi:hypothetical protein
MAKMQMVWTIPTKEEITCFFIYIRAKDTIYMVDITSLKARLARLRLGSEFDDKNPDLADPVTIERKKKKKQKKAAQDPYNEYTKNTGDKRKKKNKLKRSDQKRGKKQDLVADENKRNMKFQKKKKKKKVFTFLMKKVF